jgi:arylsulfatase A-like enzyme
MWTPSRFVPHILVCAAFLLTCPCAPAQGQADAPRPPNIVFILADDLGWTDVGYHGSEIKTPHIDRLSGEGVRLEQFYVMPVCSPTRASLMTGRYPIRYGLQTGVVRPWASYGLPLDERTLPSALKDAGYTTAIAGKWHLGQAGPELLPTRRGFDHQYGHYTGAIDYFKHDRMGGHDWHRNDKALYEEGYSTQLIGKEAVRLITEHDGKKPFFLYVTFNAPHSPLQAPEDYLKRYAHFANKQRQAYAAMVTCMDEQIGAIADALDKKGMTKNTLIVFSSDNGGPINFGATNGKLRAGKGTLYEGGIRAVAWARWPGILKPGTCETAFHMVDWYPTLIGLAGGDAKQKLPLDGMDVWPTLTEGKPRASDLILHNVEQNRGAIRQGNWKLVVQGPLPQREGKELTRVELFDLSKDAGEATNLAAQHADKVKELLAKLNAFAKAAALAKGGAEDKPPNWKAPKVYGEKDK